MNRKYVRRIGTQNLEAPLNLIAGKVHCNQKYDHNNMNTGH